MSETTGDDEVPAPAIVVAVADNGVIGRDGDLPWRLPNDLRHFKELTWGHLLIMGRRTFESIGRPLPGRRTVVLSRSGFRATGVTTVNTLSAALALATTDDGGALTPFVVGGAAVYAEALPRAHTLHWTAVHGEPEGDVRFPPVDWSQWELVEDDPRPADHRHAVAYGFRRYRRRIAV